jgi:hypothetical protein
VLSAANVVRHSHVSAKFGVDIGFVPNAKSVNMIVLSQMLDLKKLRAIDTFL